MVSNVILPFQGSEYLDIAKTWSIYIKKKHNYMYIIFYILNRPHLK